MPGLLLTNVQNENNECFFHALQFIHVYIFCINGVVGAALFPLVFYERLTGPNWVFPSTYYNWFLSFLAIICNLNVSAGLPLQIMLMVVVGKLLFPKLVCCVKYTQQQQQYQNKELQNETWTLVIKLKVQFTDQMFLVCYNTSLVCNCD